MTVCLEKVYVTSWKAVLSKLSHLVMTSAGTSSVKHGTIGSASFPASLRFSLTPDSLGLYS